MPLIAQLVDAGHLREAEDVWQQELNRGVVGLDAYVNDELDVLRAQLHVASGRTEQALDVYKVVLHRLLWVRSQLSRARSERPDDTEVGHVLVVLVAVYNRLGDLQSRLGRPDAARQAHEEALAVAQHRATSRPDDNTAQRDMSATYEKLGDASLRLDEMDEAREFYDKSLQLAEGIATASPGDSETQYEVSVACERLGDLFRRRGASEAARAYYERSLTTREIVARQEPNVTRCARDLATACERLGDLLLSSGHGGAAQQLYERSLHIRQQLLTTKDPQRADLQAELAIPLIRLGRHDRAHLQRTLSTLQELDANGCLPADRQVWIAAIEGMLNRSGQ